MSRPSRATCDDSKFPRLPAPSILLPALLGLAIIGFVVAVLQHRGSVIPLLAPVVLSLAVLFLIRPPLGLLAMLLCLGIVRVQVGTGTGSPIVASLGCALLLCACWLAHQILHRKRINLLPAVVAIPSILLIWFTWFSFLWGRATLDPRIIGATAIYTNFLRVQIAAGMLIVVSVALLFIGADLLRHPHLRAAVVAAIIGIGFLALPSRMFEFTLPVLRPSVSGLFGLWFVALCWAHALINRRLPDWLRMMLAIGALAWLYVQCVLQTGWTSGWLPAVLALFLVTLLARPRLGVILALVGLVIVLAFSSFFYDIVITTNEAEGSIGGEFGRVELVERNLAALKDHLVFGTGPAGYALYYMTFLPGQAMSTHSNFMDILAEVGIFGLLSFMGLLAMLGWIGLRMLPKITESSDRATAIAVLGGLPGAFISMALGDWVIPFVYNQTIAGFDHSVYTWLMFAILCGLWAERRYPLEGYA